ncbi:hypothetical protein CSC09_5399 (plasmid) [Escherichia coli]|nr:hypothetical protein CSC09_5399 [Escherichia coli]
MADGTGLIQLAAMVAGKGVKASLLLNLKRKTKAQKGS